MTCRLVALAVDAEDPLGLAHFWAEALGWDVDVENDDVVVLLPTDGTTFELLFLRVPDARPDRDDINKIHLDLTSSSIDDQQDVVARLIEMGARNIDIGQGQDETHVVLADPEGNEFCIIEPENKFLSGCGRFGSITCDGSVEVGKFWSEVLGWPLVWDQDDETAIRAEDGTGPFITWGPPIPSKAAKNRLHLDIASRDRGAQLVEVGRLESLGATRVDIGQCDVSWVVMADPDGNEFCVLDNR